MDTTTGGTGAPAGSRVSAEAVREATGRGWDEWFAVLDAAGAAELPHGEIVAEVTRRGHPAVSGWWQLGTITVEYERARGKRAVGQTADAGFQVGVQRSVAATVEEAWELVTARPELWLGEGAEVAFAVGERYRVPAGRGAPGADELGPGGEARGAPEDDLAAGGLARAGDAQAHAFRVGVRQDRGGRAHGEAPRRGRPRGDVRPLARGAGAGRRGARRRRVNVRLAGADGRDADWGRIRVARAGGRGSAHPASAAPPAACPDPPEGPPMRTPQLLLLVALLLPFQAAAQCTSPRPGTAPASTPSFP